MLREKSIPVLVGGYEPASKNQSHNTRATLGNSMEQGERDYNAHKR